MSPYLDHGVVNKNGPFCRCQAGPIARQVAALRRFWRRTTPQRMAMPAQPDTCPATHGASFGSGLGALRASALALIAAALFAVLPAGPARSQRSEEHTSELQSHSDL